MTNDARAVNPTFPWKGLLLLIALVRFAIFRSYLGTRLDSFTIDEPCHLVAGTSYIRTGDFRLNPEHRADSLEAIPPHPGAIRLKYCCNRQSISN